ncbi:MAG TPA: hypothetical protein VGE45_17300 [Chloroflexia bacterium]|jgi:hypothetical protein
MAKGEGKASGERREAHRVERHAERPAASSADHEDLASPETEIAVPYPTSLFGDSRLSGRGNRPVQIAAMRSMQQTYGNRATQRFLQRTRSAGAGAGTISPQGPPLIQGLPLTPLLSLPVAVQRQGEEHDDEEQGSGEVATLGPASAPAEQEELPVQTTRAHTTHLPVQRQDPPTKTKPAPNIPSGTYVVEISNGADGQGYVYTFNSEDVKKWGSWGNTAFGYYIRDVFQGGTDTIAAEYISQRGIKPEGDAKKSALKGPTTRIGITGGLHKAVVKWMAQKHPEVLPRGTSAGYHDLGEQHGGGGSQPGGNGAQNGQPGKKADPNADFKVNTGGRDVASADLQKIRELFERLRKNYPDHVVFSEGGLTIEDFLQFLADNPDALKRLPPASSGGAPVKNTAELKNLLDKVNKYRTSRGSATGSPKGSPRGVEGGAEDGVIKFEPVGKLLLTPDEDKYVKGSNLRMRVDFDRSDSERALLNVFPGRARFDWTIWRDGKRFDDGPTLEALGGYNEYDVDLGEPGSYTVQVNVKSPRFKDDKELDLTSKPLVVVEEKEREKEVFDKALVGKDDENMPFERDEHGNLKLKGGRKPLSVDEELLLIDLQVGAINSLAQQGKISASDKENFLKYFEAQKKALEGIKTKATDKPYFVRGTFLSRETSSHMELKSYMFQTKREKVGPNLKYGVILHDTTLSPDNPTQHPGEGSEVGNGPDDKQAWAKAERKAVDEMTDHWHTYNDYPDGKVHLGIKMNEDDSVYEKVIETHNARKTTKKWLGYVSTAAGVVLLAATPFTAGTSAAVGVLLITATAAGTAALILEVQDRYEKEGELKLDGRLVLDILQLVTAALGVIGTFSSALKVAGAVGKGMFLATMAGLDVAQGVLISDQVRQQIIAIEAQYAVIIGTETDPAKKEMLIKERNSAVAQVLGAAAVNGGFILISLASGAKQLQKAGRMTGKRYTVREEFKGIVESNDPAVIRRALDEHSAGTKVLTNDERAYLEEALAKTPTKKPEEAGNTGNNKTTPADQGGGKTTPTAETPREVAMREAAADDLAKQGLAKLEKLFGAKKVDDILGAVPKDEMNGFLKTIDDPAFNQQLGHDFFKGLATRPEAMEFARANGGDLLATFYRRYGWTTELVDSLRQARAKLDGAATPEARKQMIDAMKAARDKAALDKILGKAPPPKPARPAKATKATMGVDRSHSSWKAFRADAVDDAKAHGETLTPEQLDIRADLEMVRDRAKRGHLDNLGHDSKLSILDRFDELAKQSGMAQGPLNGKRGDLAESLFNPDYGTKRYAFKGGKEFNLKDVPQNQRNAYTKPDYRLDETGVVEWVEQKSDLIDRGTKSGDVFTSGKAAANEYVKHAKSDAPDLPPGDKYSIDFIRDPGPPTRQAMLDILFAADSPVYRVKFGETWYTRP